MSFLVWNNQKDAEDSLAAVNIVYGCPYVAVNGYRMDQWDFVVTSNDGNSFGFYKPEERLGKKMADLMPALVLGYIEHAEMPIEFRPEDPDEFRIEGDEGDNEDGQ